MGDFEGLLILTWDANEKAYKAYAFGNEFPGAIVETGQFEGWSRDVARWVRFGLSVTGPFVCRCLTIQTMLRFHIPLIGRVEG
jgi:hypothetical protein